MNNSPDLLTTGIKMIGSLALVLGGMFVAIHFIKKHLNQKSAVNRDKLIRILGSRYLGVKKTISLVEVPGSVLVLGITNDRITLLDKIDDEKVLDSVQQSFEGKKDQSFFKQFQKMKNKAEHRITEP